MDGLLVVDKPAGPTSHDVVTRVRRVLRERRAGHTGTLDPLATGVLLIVLGRATRLARFLSATDKTYEAVLRLGISTDSADAEGTPIGDRYTGPIPSRQAIDTALDAFRGTFLQQPPIFSAKKIRGKRSYELARGGQHASTGARTPPLARSYDDASLGLSNGARAHPSTTLGVTLSPSKGQHARRRAVADPVSVTAHSIEVMAVESDRLILRIQCSAGFYVRSLAHDLGERLGTGAHVTALRRTRSGEYTVASALPLEAAERDAAAAAAAVLPLNQVLTSLDSVVLTPEGVRFATHGRNLAPGVYQPLIANPQFLHGLCRLLSPTGELVGIAEAKEASGSLHPFVVLV